jgi:hypothetical protein
VTDPSTGPSGAELRAHYGSPQTVDAGPVLEALGRTDVPETWAVAFRYQSVEVCEAFATGNKAHHGYESLGPVAIDGAIYGVVIVVPETYAGGDPCRD